MMVMVVMMMARDVLIRQVIVRGHVQTESQLVVQRVAERSHHVLTIGQLLLGVVKQVIFALQLGFQAFDFLKIKLIKIKKMYQFNSVLALGYFFDELIGRFL
jgi:hypothetical protein